MDTIETLMKRRSCRAYKPGPVPDEHLGMILEAGRYAPSAGNTQPWRFVITRNSELKDEVSEACGEQYWLANADIILAGIGVPEESRGREDWKWYPVDVAIAMENMILAATALSYGTCWIGAFDQEQVKELLDIPSDMHIVALASIGVSDDVHEAPPRKSWAELFSEDKYGSPLSI